MSTSSSILQNFLAARSTIKDLARMRQIAAVLIRHGFGHVFRGMTRNDKLLAAELEDLTREKSGGDADGSRSTAALAERLPLALQELGPTFVKLGQILSTRQDLIPSEYCTALARLQDQVSPIAVEDIRKVIETSLGRPIEAMFDEFDETPLACASIAQVHTAKRKTGEAVVIKVQRPGVRESIEADLSILHFFARKLEESFPEIRAFEPTAIALEFDRAIRRELDFTGEARNSARFSKNFESWPLVHIPKVFTDQSTDRVLVMERLYGVKIIDAVGRHDMDVIANEVVRMLFKQVFEDGFFHGDLHPGNLFVLDDKRIGLIDFGLVGRMSPAMREALADLLLALSIRSYEGVARALYDISLKTDAVNYNAWERDVTELMDQHLSSTSLADVDFGAVIRDIIDGAMRHKVRVPPDYTMFFKALMTVEGIGKQISPDLDIIAACQPYVEGLIAKRYQPDALLRTAVDSLNAFAKLGRRLPASLQQILQQIDDRNLGIQVNDPNIERRLNLQRRLVNRTLLVLTALALWFFGIALEPFVATQLWAQRVQLGFFAFGSYLLVRVLLRIRDEIW
jgi:ubiquinone biosynthesis protein